jgi:perosamine synthetase
MIPVVKPTITEEDKKAVLEVLDSGMLAQGKEVAEFEKRFAEYCGCRNAVAVNSGTAALHTALYAIGIREGDEVITSPFTFVASANAILMQNAKVVFADIRKDTFNIDPKEIEKKITEHTKAIVAVDLFGQMADYDAISKIAKKHGLLIVEDAAQAVGAEISGSRAGNVADIAGFSLYATKNLMCGEGGVVTTNNDEYAELCRRFRHHGQSEKTRYQYYDIGYNYRMTNIAAAIGLVQLGKIDEYNEKRKKNAEALTKGLSDTPGIVVPAVKQGAMHVFHQYTILVDPERRDDIMNRIKEKGCGCAVFYPKPLHLHPHFGKLGYSEGDFPAAEETAKRCISLPVHPMLSDEDISKIIETVKEAVK